MADFNYEKEDGIWKHLEFESDCITTADLWRFRVCEAGSCYHYGVKVSTYVLCTSKIKIFRSQISQVFGVYRVEILRMKYYNADETIRSYHKNRIVS